MTPIERVRQLRSQMLIHSHIYYRWDSCLISDLEFDRRAKELAALQQQLFMPIDWYDDAFADWDGSTGYHLPYDDWINQKARQLMQLHERRNEVSFL